MAIIIAKTRIFTHLPVRMLDYRYFIQFFVYINIVCFLFSICHEIAFKDRAVSPYLYHALLCYLMFKWGVFNCLSSIDSNMQDY